MIQHKSFFVALSIVSAQFSAYAGESCALLSSRLLSEGNNEQLSALFKEPAVFAPGLKNLAAQVGTLSAMEQVKETRFKQHKRISVGKTSGEYVGTWVNANSTRLGPVQLHIAQSLAVKCELLALHVDYAQ